MGTQIKDNKTLLLIIYLCLFVAALFLGNYLKNKDIQKYKKETFLEKVNKSNLYLQVLIKEKQNTTTTIGIGLANTKQIIDIFKYGSSSNINLNDYSLQLRNNTDFKNVWFQVIDKNGISIQRSWTDYKNDRIANARKDIEKFIKNPKISNSISVGKFDMTFKSMIPVNDYDTGEFLGLIEVITHFNSIAKKLKKDDIDAIFLVDNSYASQITKPFTKLFVEDYYVANLNADRDVLAYLESKDVTEFIKNVRNNDFVLDDELDALVSYFCIRCVAGKDMGHVLLVHSLDSIDLDSIQEISYLYNLYILFFIIIISLIFYFMYTFNTSGRIGEIKNFKLISMMIVLYCFLTISVYKFIEIKYDQEIDTYKKNLQEQTVLEYNSIINRNKDIADLIFSQDVNNKEVIELFKQRDRQGLLNKIEKRYGELKKKYNVRQMHFHLPDSTSFLRVHKPEKFGDSLKGVRQSVDHVNKHLKPFYGFEEGKIYNGFRHVYPLFDENEKHLGSVEVSFDIYAFMDSFLNIFKVKRLNFLVNAEISNKKLFEESESNYQKSPIEGFYFDKLVLEKLERAEKRIIPHKKSKEQLALVGNSIRAGKVFLTHFENAEELVVVIPMINKISKEVVASIHIAKNDKFVQIRLLEFKQFITLFLIILAFVVLFIYREYISKAKVRLEFEKNQKILDSQNSFIIISDGISIKAANRSLLRFFGFDTIEDFQEKYECICETFESEEGKNYIQAEMGDLNWFEYIKKHQNEENLVKIIANDGSEHIYYIEFDQSNKLNKTDYIITFLDITNIKNIENQLIQSEKLASLGNMIGNIAHQWRQPLSVISTSASGVKMKNDFGNLTNEEIDKFMDRIVDNSQYLSETIDTFRNFIKSDSEVTDVHIQKELGEIAVLMSASLENNFIKLETQMDESVPFIKTMPHGILIQVMTNIINNAKDALLENNIENPHITLQCIKKENIVHILVEDNGGGIPDSIASNIFEPYFTTKHESVGTGLGLYMSHKLVTESMNGKLYFTNTKEGTMFHVEIPIDEE